MSRDLAVLAVVVVVGFVARAALLADVAAVRLRANEAAAVAETARSACVSQQAVIDRLLREIKSLRLSALENRLRFGGTP